MEEAEGTLSSTLTVQRYEIKAVIPKLPFGDTGQSRQMPSPVGKWAERQMQKKRRGDLTDVVHPRTVLTS
jgi:hypothetical protein